jgi:hypothetical protein
MSTSAKQIDGTGDGLDKVLARLDALEIENARLTAEVSELRAPRSSVTSRPRPADVAPAEPVSRRALLGKLGAASAVAAGATLLSAKPAAAANDDDLVWAGNNNGTRQLGFTGNTQPTGGVGVEMAIFIRDGAQGTGPLRAALRAVTIDSPDPCIVGHSNLGIGILGSGWEQVNGFPTKVSSLFSYAPAGVAGDGLATRDGVRGTSENGTGVAGLSATASGVFGLAGAASAIDVTTRAGLRGDSTNQHGVFGTSSGAAGVFGRSASGDGVRGQQGGGGSVIAPTGGVRGDAPAQPGVVGTSDANHGVFGRAGLGVGPSTPQVAGVRGDSASSFGVIGTSTDAVGLYGVSTNDNAVFGQKGAASGINPFKYAGVRGDGASDAAGVIGTSYSSEGVIGISHVSAGVQGHGSHGVRGDADSDGAGVIGVSPGGAGLRAANVGGGRLLLDPRSTDGPPSSGAFVRGEMMRDFSGALWLCTVAGSPGTWVRAATVKEGFNGGSVNLLSTPIRLLDTRFGIGVPGGTAAKLAKGASVSFLVAGRTVGAVTIPTGIKAVIGNLAVTNTETTGTGGYLAMYPEGAPVPGTASINWFGANQNLNNGITAAVNLSNGQATITNGGVGGSAPTDVVFDAVGFVF